MPMAMAVSAATEFDREVHVAGDDDEARPIAMTPSKVDASTMLAKMPSLEKIAG